ncbi:MAG TPA: FecR domain-containing protein [Hyphomonadaceae bacterium]|nr:FecR domain-containing protein [Hyphomonadaceae bacterium]
MTGPNVTEDEQDNFAAARWVMAIEEGLSPEHAEAFHVWLAARPERAELIARQAALPGMARHAQRQAQLEGAAQRLAQQDLARRRANEQALRSRRRFLVGGAIAAGAAALAVAAVMAPRDRGEHTAEVVPEELYETTSGEVRVFDLADASRIWLDAHTQVSVRMTRKQRDITLAAGRLFVDVARDPDRPLFVRNGQFEARAVAAAFEATAFADRTGIAVTEGIVRLTGGRGGRAIDLGKGQCAWLSASGEIATSSASAIAAWRQRRMVLSDRRLDAALAELSRYFNRPLTVADAQLAARRITLSFSIADLTEAEAARIIANAVGADLSDQANAGILLSPAAGGADAGVGARVNPR